MDALAPSIFVRQARLGQGERPASAIDDEQKKLSSLFKVRRKFKKMTVKNYYEKRPVSTIKVKIRSTLLLDKD